MSKIKNYFYKKIFLYFLFLNCSSILISEVVDFDEEAALGFRKWSGKKSDVFSNASENQGALGTRPSTPGIEQVDSILNINQLENYIAQQKTIKVFNQEVILQEERNIIGVEEKRQWQGVFKAPIQYKNLLIKNARLTINPKDKVLEVYGNVSFFDLFDIDVKLSFMTSDSPKAKKEAKKDKKPSTLSKIKGSVKQKAKEFKSKAENYKEKTSNVLPHTPQEQEEKDKEKSETDLRIIIEGNIPVNNLKPFNKTGIPALKDITIREAIVLFDFSTALSLGIQIGCVCEILNTTVIGSIGIERSKGKFSPVMKVELPDEWSIGDSVPFLKNSPLDLLKFQDVQFVVAMQDYFDEEMDGLEMKKGINIVATLMTSGPLDKMSKLLGNPVPELRVYGSISPDPRDVKFGTIIPFNIPFKNSRVRSGSVALELTGKPSMALKFILLVSPTDLDKLALIAKVEMDPVSAILSGTMQGEWNDPFGIVGLSIADLAIQTALSYTSPIAISGFGYTGKVKMGKQFMGVGMNVSTDPKDFIVYGQLLGSLSLADILAFAQDIATRALEVSKDPKKLGQSAGASLALSVTPLGPVVLGSLFAGIAVGSILGKVPPEILPDISINDPKLLVAPNGGYIGEIKFDKGITLKGALSILGQKFMIDFNVSFQGFWAKAAMSEIILGTEKFPLMRITGPGIESSSGKDVKKGPMFDIEVASNSQHVQIDGTLEILGMKQEGKLMISRKGLSFSITKNVAGFLDTTVSGQAPFNITDPDFMVSILIRTSKLYQIVKDAVRSALNKVPGIREVGDLVIDPVLDAFDLRKLEGSLRLKDLEKVKLPRLTVDAVLFGQSIGFSIQADLSDPDKIKDFIVDGVLDKIKDAIWNLIKDPLMAVKLLGEKAARELVNAAETIGKGLQKGAEEIRDVAKKSAEKLKDIGAAGVQVAKDVGEKGIDTAKVAGQQTAAVAKTAGIFVGDNVTRSAKEVASGVENASRVAVGGIQAAANALKNAFEDLGNAIKDAAEAVLGAIGIDTGAKERRKREAEERVRKQIEGLIAQSNDYIAKVLTPLEKMALEEQNAGATIRNQVQEYYAYVPPAIKDNEYKSKVMGYLSMVNSIKQSVEEMKKQVANGSNQIRNTINPTIDSIVKAIPQDIPESVMPTVNKLNEIIVHMREKSGVIANIFTQTADVLTTITNEPNGGNINKFTPNILNMSEIEALRLEASLTDFYLSKLNEWNNKATQLFNRIRDNRNAIEGEKNSPSGLIGIIGKVIKMTDLQNQIRQDIDTFNQILPAANFIHDLLVKTKQDYMWIVLRRERSTSLMGEEKALYDRIDRNKGIGDNYHGKIAYASEDPIMKQPLMTPQQITDAAVNTYKNAAQIKQRKEDEKQAQEASKREFERQQLIMKQTPTSLFESDNSYMRITNQYGNFNDVDMGVIYNKFNKVGALEEFNKVIKDLALAMSNSGGRSTANLNNFDFAKELIMTKALKFNDLRNVAKKFRVEIPESSLDPIANLVASKLKYLNDRSKELVRELPVDKAVLYMDVGKLFASNPTKKNIIISDFRTRLGSRLGFTPNDNQLEQCLIQKTTANNNSPLNSIFSDFWRWDEPKKQIIYNEVTNALNQIVNMFPYELQTQNIYLPNPASISADASYNLIKKSYPTLESINPSALFYTTGYITPEWKSAIEKMLGNLKPLITNFDFAHRLVLNKAITFDKVKEIARQYGNPAFSNIELDFICNQVADTIIKLDQIYKNLKQATPQAPVAVATSSESSFNNIKKKYPSVVNIDPVGVYNMFGYITNPWRNEINKLNDSLKQVNINNFDFVNKLVLSKAITFDKVKDVAKQFGNPHFSDSQLDFICNQVADTIVRLDQVYQELALG